MEEAKKAGFWDVVKQGTSIYLKNIWVIVALDLISLIPSLVYAHLSVADSDNLWSLPLGLLNFFLPVLNMGALFTVFAAGYRGEKIGFKDAFMKGLKLWPRMFIVSLVVGLVTGLGMILLIIPGIILGAKFFYAIPAAVEEDKTDGPLGRGWRLSKGNMGMILLLMFAVYLPLCAPAAVAIILTLSNLFLLLTVATVLGLVSTIAQAIHYVAYAKAAESAPAEPAQGAAAGETPAKKGIGWLGGCLIAVLAVVLLFAAIGGGAYYVYKYVGFTKLMRGFMGSTMKLSEDIICTYPDRWYGMPVQGTHTSFMVLNADLISGGEKQGMPGAFFRSVPFPEEFSRSLKAVDAAEYMIKMEKEIADSSTIDDHTPVWDIPEGLRSEEVRLGTQKWRRLVLDGKTDSGEDGQWRILYTRSGEKFVYFYYNSPNKKTDRKAYAADEKALYGMVADATAPQDE